MHRDTTSLFTHLQILSADMSEIKKERRRQERFVLFSSFGRTQLMMASEVFTMARSLAIVHIIIGLLLVCFGIADRVVDYGWTGRYGFGIWIGLWVSFQA